jgi:hypothetical protein
VSLRIDRDVVARFRAAGDGWQTRVNEALKGSIAESALNFASAGDSELNQLIQ